MPEVVIYNLSPKLIEMLELKAKRHDRTLQSYLKMVVENAAKSSDVVVAENCARLNDMIGVRCDKDGIERRPDGSVYDPNLRPDGTPWMTLDRLDQA